MTESINEQIADLQNDFVYFGEVETAEGQEVALKAKHRGDTLTLVRDTLISIAMNQSGLASHAAQDALGRVGLCYHFTQDYLHDTHDESVCGYTCTECRKFSKEKMEPFA